MMNRRLAFLFIVLFWAAAYLPGLGTAALKGEEARRTLPAVEMLNSGDWLVPHLNGVPYLRKPPLLNWAIAVSLYVVNDRDEWVVRMPSVLAMLAMAAVIFWTGTRWLSTSGAFVAAIIALSGIGLWEKGRLAEIDALYSALTGMAFALWLAAWMNRETGWRLWFFPVLCLGVATLAKGPMHLLLFYGVVIPLLVVAGEKRQLWAPAHWVALGLAVLLVAAWAVPYLHATASLNPESVWANQMNNSLGRGKVSRIWSNELNSLANGLPWILFIPLLWSRRAAQALDERRWLFLKTARWVMVVALFGLVMIPGMLPRYTLPLQAVGALLLAMVLPAASLRSLKLWGWFCLAVIAAAIISAAAGPLWVRPGRVDWLALLPFALFCAAFPFLKKQVNSDGLARTAAFPALAFAAAVGVYAAVGVPRFHQDVPALLSGRGITEAVPQEAVLYVVDPGYEPVFFYINRRCVYVQSVKDLPKAARYVLAAQKADQNIEEQIPNGHKAGIFQGMGKRQLVLLTRDKPNGNGPVRPVASR